MANPYDIDHRLMEIIVRTPGSSLDDIVSEFPDLTWSQVFLTIDRLSREGALKLTLKGRYLYAVAARSATVLPFRPEFLQSGGAATHESVYPSRFDGLARQTLRHTAQSAGQLSAILDSSSNSEHPSGRTGS